MSSHLITTEVPLETLKFVTKFDPDQFKQLRKEKRGWLAYAIAATVLFVIVFVSTIELGMLINVSALLLAAPIITVWLRVVKASHALEPVAEARALVLRSNALADTWAMRDEQENAPFVVKTERSIFVNARPRVFEVEYRDPMLVPLLFHISPTFVGTLRGPNIASVIGALELAGTVNQSYDQSANGIMSYALPVEVNEVDQSIRDAMALQEG